MKKIIFMLVACLGMSLSTSAQFMEDFEGMGIPPGWTVINQGSANTWVFGVPAVGSAYNGSQVASILYNTSPAHDDYLITPSIAVTANTSDRLTFYARNRSASFLEEFNVLISTTGTAASDFTINLAGGPQTPPITWAEYQYNLSAYIGQNIYIAIQAISVDKWELYIDDFTIDGLPACPEPSALSATNLTSTTADLGWAENGTATLWDIEWGPAGFTSTGIPNIVGATTNPHLLLGLTPQNSYDFYVRSDCASSGTSNWVGPHTFQTSCTVVLNGSYTIPGDFATIEDAIAQLNLCGISGAVTFNVAANHSETVTDPIILTATGTAIHPIIFQKSGAGNNPLITRTDAGTLTTSTLGGQGDAVVIIEGSDYVTFDGIDVSATDSGIEYGYYIRRAGPTNGSKFVTIQNSVVTMNKGTSGFVVGIYSSNNDPTSLVSSAVGITVTSTDGIHENITIKGNTVQNVHVGIKVRGFNAASPWNLYDQNFKIGEAGEGNTIHNFGGGSTTSSYGIYMIYHNDINVTENQINNVASGGSSFLNATNYGIFTSTANNANVTIANNTLNLEDGGTTSLLAGISNAAGGSGAGNTVEITDNNVTLNYDSATSAAMTGIVNSASASTITISGNTVANSTLSGTGTFTGIDGGGATSPASEVTLANNTVENNTKTGASGSIFSIRAAGSNVTANDNLIHSNGFDNSSGTASCIVYGYYNFGSPPVENIYGNEIYNLYVSGSNTGTASIMAGILTNTTGTATKNIYNNAIYDLNALSGVASGINTTLGSDVRIYRNTVNDVSNASTANTVGRVNGILINSGTVYAYNNYISRLFAPESINVDAVRGISSTSTTASSTVGLYYNTIFLNASSSGGNFGSSGIFHTFSTTATSATLDMRNNNIVNHSTPNGTGRTVAFRRSAATNLNNYGEISNNNNFYAGTPSSENLIYFDGTNADETIDDFKSRVSPREGSSFSGNPPFINSTTPPYDLRISTTTPTQLESAGTPITTPIIVDEDFDGDTRNSSTPDVGADEFDGLALDLSAPLISFTPLGNTASTTGRILSATITDATGVPTAGIGLPVLYWSINNIAGPFTAAQGTHISGDDYEFTFGTGVATGDVIHYYIAAQDTAPAENVGVSPTVGASGFTSNPPAASTPPTTPESYEIFPSISGTYTVGIGEDYDNLTAVSAALNSSVVAGNVIFELTNNYDGTIGETLPIVFSEFISDVPGFSVTIRPATGVTDRVTSGDPGSNFAFPVINFVGGKHFILDGRPGGLGTSNEWTIRNTRAVATIGPVLRFADDAAYNTVQYLNLESQATLTTTGMVFFHTSSGSIGNSHNSILNNTFQPRTDVGSPSFSNGILSNGSLAAPNTGNTVSDNHFINFNNIGISLVTTNTGNGPDWVITGNHFYNPTHSSTAAQTGISVASEAATNTLISGNFIGGSGPGATGTMTHTGTGIVTGILVSNGVATIEDNTIANITQTGTGTAVRLRGIYLTSGNDGNEIIDNHIFNLSTMSTGTGLGAGAQPVVGISVWTGGTFFTTMVTGNTIHNLSADNPFVNAVSNTACGMFLTNVGMGSIVANNMIYDIKNKATGTTANQPPIAAGIFIRFIQEPGIYNNMISLGFGENTNTQFAGIMLVAGGATNTNQYVHNSIAIDGTSSGAHNSFGILRGDNTAVSVESPVNLYNNAVSNTRSGGGSLNFAVGSQGSNATLNLDSNYNVFYSSDATTIGLLDGTPYTFDDWKTAISGDANSISADPLFVSATDLTPLFGSPVFGAGTPVPSVTTDITGAARDGVAPSIGAYENGLFSGFVWESGMWTPSNPMLNAGPTDDVMVVDGTATFNADMDINNLYVNAGATLHIENVLKANGNIDNNGSMVFVSNLSNTGQLDTFTGNITGSGLVTVQRYIPARRAFRLLSSAVNTTTSIHANLQEGANNTGTSFPGDNNNPNPGFGTHITGSATGLNGFDATPSGNPSIFILDNMAQSWVALPNTDAFTMNAGGAIRLMVRGDRSINVTSNSATPTNTTLRATGTLVTGPQTQSAMSDQAGDFNFFGNPYQAVVDMNSVISGSSNINSNFYYVWDPTLAGTNGRGAYVTVDLPGGTNASGSAANQYLQPSQAAFVSTLANAPASLTFEESHKAVTQPQTTVFSITSKLDIRLYDAIAFANNEKAADGLRLKFAADGNNTITPLDALKFYNLDENLATSHNGKLYSIESRALPQVGEHIGLFTNQYRSTTYVFEADLTELDGVTAYLRDNHIGTETELVNNALTLYPFNVDSNNPNSMSEQRFDIVFKEVTLDINDENFGSGFVLFPNPAKDNIFFIATNGLEGQIVTVRMNNILGQQVFLESQKVGSNGRLQINTPGLKAGVYIVTLTAKDGNSFIAKLINK